MNQKPEYHGMLCLSTAHLTQFAMHYLEKSCQENSHETAEPAASIVAYPKNGYGYFVAITPDMSQDDTLPASIRQCASYAESHQADWLMFDTDGPVMDGLPEYETQ